MRWQLPVTGLITDLLLFVPLYNYCKFHHVQRNLKLLIKGICIGFPLLLLIVGAVDLLTLSVFDIASFILIAGMVLCAVGDILLEVRFIRGGILFACGYGFYIVALLLRSPFFSYVQLIVFFLFFTGGNFLTVKLLSRKYRTALIIYNTLISAAFALSLSFVASGEKALVFLGFGVILLVVSDWLLARNRYVRAGSVWTLIALMLYFSGQLLISFYPYFIEFL